MQHLLALMAHFPGTSHALQLSLCSGYRHNPVYAPRLVDPRFFSNQSCWLKKTSDEWESPCSGLLRFQLWNSSFWLLTVRFLFFCASVFRTSLCIFEGAPAPNFYGVEWCFETSAAWAVFSQPSLWHPLATGDVNGSKPSIKNLSTELHAHTHTHIHILYIYIYNIYIYTHYTYIMCIYIYIYVYIYIIIYIYIYIYCVWKLGSITVSTSFGPSIGSMGETLANR